MSAIEHDRWILEPLGDEKLRIRHKDWEHLDVEVPVEALQKGVALARGVHDDRGRPEPKWLLVLRASDRAARDSSGSTGPYIFDKKGLDQALGRASRDWISRLVQLQLVSAVWDIETTGETDYTVTKFGREVLGMARMPTNGL